MTTTAVSTTKTINVAGIGPVELTVEERGDGPALSGAAWRRGSTVSRRVRPAARRRRAATGYSRPPIPASAAHSGRTS